MEPPSESGSFKKGFVFLLGFTSLMAFFVYIFFKFTGRAELNTNGNTSIIFISFQVIISYFWNAKSHEAYHFSEESKRANSTGKESRGTVGDAKKGAKKGKKDKPLRERERTLSKGDDSFEHKWLQTTLKGHSEEVESMTFSPNFKYLASLGNGTSTSSRVPTLCKWMYFKVVELTVCDPFQIVWCSCGWQSTLPLLIINSSE